MNVLVVEVIHVILFRTGPDVAVTVEVGLHHAIVARHQGEAPDVELPPLIKQRVVYVLLEDHRPLA